MNAHEFRNSWGDDDLPERPASDGLEPYAIIDPPEIRSPKEGFSVVEFYQHLGESRPDVRLFTMVANWLQDQPARPIIGLFLSYHSETTEGEPDMLVGRLVVGQPIDMG